MGCDEQVGGKNVFEQHSHIPKKMAVPTHGLTTILCTLGQAGVCRKICFHTAEQERFPNVSANNNESWPGPMCEIKCHTSSFSLTALLLQLFKSYKILGCCTGKVEAGTASCRSSITP